MIKRELVFVFIFILFLEGVSASLGVSPAMIDINFVPGSEYEFTFTIISDDPEKNIAVYAEGDLSEYVTLSRTELKGPGTVLVKLKLPQEIKVPGIHGISIGARERPTEEGFISAIIDIRAVIRIHVPYPGKYAEIRFDVEDGNLNDLIPIEVYVSNKGKESLDLNVGVEFFDDIGNRIQSMNFNPVKLESANENYFQKYLNTTGFKPGNYIAEASVYYGDIVKKNSSFRLGSLFVNVTNFTNQLPNEGIQKFLVDIESMWNGDLQGVYADINISNSTKSIEFRTPSIDLERWSKKTLTGFIDTNDLSGVYNTNITLYYFNEKSSTSGELRILNVNVKFIVWMIGAIVSIVLVLIGLKMFVFGKNKK